MCVKIKFSNFLSYTMFIFLLFDSPFLGYQQSLLVVKIGGRENQCSQAGSESLKGISHVFGSHYNHHCFVITYHDVIKREHAS